MSLSSRKNGRKASCEPCRKAKARCDHETPICARCRARGMASRCWYHPAPMTKRLRPATRDPSIRNAVLEAEHPAGPSPAVSLAPLRPSSRASDGPDDSPNTFLSMSRDPGREEDDHQQRLGLVKEMIEVLRDHFEAIRQFVSYYYARGQVVLMPARMFDEFLKGIQTNPLFMQVNAPHSALSAAASLPLSPSSSASPSVTPDGALLRLAESILTNTMAEIRVSPQITMEEFSSQFAGASLRIECLTMLFAVAARGCIYSVATNERGHRHLERQLVHFSRTGVQLARDLAPRVNDMTVWIAYDELLMSTLVVGDASPSVWRSMSDLVSDCFSMKLHREPADLEARIPFWLLQMRRLVFTTTYRLDKALVTCFDRPPLMPGYFCHTRMPLDLAGDDIFATEADMPAVLAHLTPDGWNLRERINPATWFRMRYLIANLHDELCPYRFKRLEPSDVSKLKLLSQKSRETWESLPSHLRYRLDCWRRPDLSLGVCFMLAKTCLWYLNIDLLIHRLIHPPEKRMASRSSVLVAREMLDIVLQITNERDRAVFLPVDLPTVFLTCGIPSAMTLAVTLQELSRNQRGKRSYENRQHEDPIEDDDDDNDDPLQPSDFNTTKTIRDLFYFVAHLDAVCGPGRLNHDHCAQASKALSRILDEVMGGFVSSSLSLALSLTSSSSSSSSSLPRRSNAPPPPPRREDIRDVPTSAPAPTTATPDTTTTTAAALLSLGRGTMGLESLSTTTPSMLSGYDDVNAGGEADGIPMLDVFSQEALSTPGGEGVMDGADKVTLLPPSSDFDPVEWAFNIDWTFTNGTWDYPV